MEVTRRLLRKEQTESEDALWEVLRNRRFENLKFRRQYSAGYFVLDFYCPQEKLAIEVDGSVHDSIEAQRYDAYRTETLNGIGIQVVRFRNEEILKNLPQVLTRIKSFLKSTSPASLEPLS